MRAVGITTAAPKPAEAIHAVYPVHPVATRRLPMAVLPRAAYVRRRERPGTHPPPITRMAAPVLEMGLYDKLVLRLEGVVLADMDRLNSLARRRQRASRGGVFQPAGRKPLGMAARLVVRPSWQFDGSLTFLGPPRLRRSGEYLFVCDLTLNFSRFANQAGRADRWDAEENLRLDRALSDRTSRETHNSRDNVILGSAFARLVQPGAIEHALSAYLAGVRREVCRDLRFLAGAEEPDDLRIDTEVVRQAEIYWEFATREARADARYFGRQLHARHARGVKTEHEHDLVSYRVDLKDGVALSTYAKTPTRVRFEVQYTKGISRSARAPGATIEERLLAARRHAHRQLLWAVRDLCPDISHSITPRRAAASVLGEISAACGGNADLFRAILEVLLDRGGIGITNNDLPAEVIQALVRKRVIVEPTGRQRSMYPATPQTEWVLNRLNSAFDLQRGRHWASELVLPTRLRRRNGLRPEDQPQK